MTEEDVVPELTDWYRSNPNMGSMANIGTPYQGQGAIASPKDVREQAGKIRAQIQPPLTSSTSYGLDTNTSPNSSIVTPSDATEDPFFKPITSNTFGKLNSGKGFISEQDFNPNPGVNLADVYETQGKQIQKLQQDIEDRTKKYQAALDNPFGFGAGNKADPGAMFQIAAGLLDPGKTGHISAGLSNAAKNLNEYQKEIRANILPLAGAQNKLAADIAKVEMNRRALVGASPGGTGIYNLAPAAGGDSTLGSQVQQIQQRLNSLPADAPPATRAALQAQLDQILPRYQQGAAAINANEGALQIASHSGLTAMPSLNNLIQLTTPGTEIGDEARKGLNWASQANSVIGQEFTKALDSARASANGSVGGIGGGASAPLSPNLLRQLWDNVVDHFQGAGPDGQALTPQQRLLLKQAYSAQLQAQGAMPSIMKALGQDPASGPSFASDYLEGPDLMNNKAKLAKQHFQTAQSLFEGLTAARKTDPTLTQTDWQIHPDYKSVMQNHQIGVNKINDETNKNAVRGSIASRPVPQIPTPPSRPIPTRSSGAVTDDEMPFGRP